MTSKITLKIKKAFVEDFFFHFLLSRSFIQRVFLHIVFVFAKTIKAPKLILLVMIILPWLMLLATLLVEILFTNTVVLFFYITALFTILKFFFRVALEISIKLAHARSRRDFITYFPNISRNRTLHALFLYNHFVKDVMLNFCEEQPENEEFLRFLIIFIGRIHYYFCLSLKLENLLYDFRQISSCNGLLI